MRKHYWKCYCCLSIAVIETEMSAPRALTCAPCAAAGDPGQMFYMGEVYRDRLAEEKSYCPCDDRCTGARGPTCDCPCGGENHGKGYLTRMDITANKIPSVTPPKDVEGNRRQWLIQKAEALRLEELAAAKFGQRWADYKARRPVSGWYELNRIELELKKILKFKTHTGRFTAIKKLEEQLKGA